MAGAGRSDPAPTCQNRRMEVDKPNMARMYDYALGGKDNFAADREAVNRLFAFSPENKHVPKANRRFLGRAVRHVASQGVRQFIDLGAGLPSLSQPTCVLFVSVLHGIPDADDPAAIVQAFADHMVPGSHLILSHLTSEGHPPELVKQKEEVFAKSPTPFSYRTRAEILHYFDGFTLVEPGLTPVTSWRNDESEPPEMTAAGAWWLGGVARKP